jgi:hypothetical protein
MSLHRRDNGQRHESRARVVEIRKPLCGRRVGAYAVGVDQVLVSASLSRSHELGAITSTSKLARFLE